MLDPVLDAPRVEEVLLVAVEACHELLILKVLPADHTLLLAVVESSPVLELVHSPQHKHLVVVVLKSVNIDKHVMLQDLFEHHDTVENYEHSNHTQAKHYHI